MTSRARLILNMATITQNRRISTESDNDPPVSTQNVQDTPETNTPAILQQDSPFNDSLDTNSIPDSQPELSLLDDGDTSIEFIAAHKKMPGKVIETSDSSSNSSNSDSDSESKEHSDSTTSKSNSSSSGDFSSDDSVKDPIFQPYNDRSSDLEDDIQSNTAQFYISSQPEPSHVEPQLPVESDTQPPNIDSHPSSVNTQPPSIDSQPSSVDAHPLSLKRKAYPESWKRNRTKTLRNSGQTAKKKGTPFVVRELTHESFLDLKSLAVGNYTTTEDGQKVKWADIEVLKVHQDYKENFFFKISYDTEEYTSVATLTKKKSKTIILPKKLYKNKLKVTETKKKNGILKLIEKNIIPKYYQSFYENL